MKSGCCKVNPTVSQPLCHYPDIRNSPGGNNMNPLGATDPLQNVGYPLKRLKLSGKDYDFSVDRKGPYNDVSVSKRGDRVTVDRYGSDNDVVIDKKGTDIYIDRPGTDKDEVIRQKENELQIDRSGFANDVKITKTDNRIEVVRTDNTKIAYEKSGNTFKIDRFDPKSNVVITNNNGSLFIDRYGDADDVRISRNDGEKDVDVGLWHKEMTIHPTAWEQINYWFNNGLDAEGLIRMTQDGNVQVIDNLFK